MMDWLTPEALGALTHGLMVTVALTLITTISASVVGVGIGWMRMSSRRLPKVAAGAFIEVFRNVPALIQIIFWAFAVPSMFPVRVRTQLFFDNSIVEWLEGITGLGLPYYAFAAGLGLTLNTGAHLAELFRAGVSTIPVVHLDAARLLGAGRWARFWSLVLPGGMRAAFPAITTRLIHNLHNTALASFVAVPDLFSAVGASVTESFRAVEFLTLGAILYLTLSTAAAAGLGTIDRRLRGRSRVSQH